MNSLNTQCLLEQVADPTFIEPNLSLILDVCEGINKKGKATQVFIKKKV